MVDQGMVHGIRTIVAEEGISGIYRGLGAVVARQGANSAVRMSTYSLLRDRLSHSYPVDGRGKPMVPWFVTFFSGMLLELLRLCANLKRCYCWNSYRVHDHAFRCSQNSTTVSRRNGRYFKQCGPGHSSRWRFCPLEGSNAETGKTHI